MLSQIINHRTLNSDFESGWFPGKSRRIANYGCDSAASSIQLVWNEVNGSMNGTIEIFASNLPTEGAKGQVYNVSSISNIGDSELIVLLAQFNFFNIKFTSNGTTGGWLDVFVEYT